MRHLAVKNFEHFQHYKDRRPPWIKLYQEVLEDYEFTRLQDASRSHLLAIWLLASRYENRIPYDADWIGRAILASSPVDLDVLISAGFLTVCDGASDTLAGRKQDAKPETEEETEAEKESAAGETKSDPRPRNASRTALKPTDQERVVLEHYTQVHPRRRWGDKEVRSVRRALVLGFSPAELNEAIDGNAGDEWHAQRKKHELSYVLRDAGQIDNFRDRARPLQLTQPPVIDGELSPEMLRLSDPLKRVS